MITSFQNEKKRDKGFFKANSQATKLSELRPKNKQHLLQYSLLTTIRSNFSFFSLTFNTHYIENSKIKNIQFCVQTQTQTQHQQHKSQLTRHIAI